MDWNERKKVYNVVMVNMNDVTAQKSLRSLSAWMRIFQNTKHGKAQTSCLLHKI